MVSKKSKDKQGKKPFKKKREQKRIKTLKERRQIMKKVQEEYKLKSTFSSNDFDKIISPYKNMINKINPNKVDHKENINFSLIIMVDIYLKNSSCPLKKDINFIQKFNEIITILSINKNEFVFWTFLIDEYITNHPNDWKLEKLFYIAICTKEKLYLNYSNCIEEYKKINNDFNEWYNYNKTLFEKDFCLLNEFNDRYQKLNFKKNFHKTFFHDYNSEVDYICNYSGNSEKKGIDIKNIIKDIKSNSDTTETNNLIKKNKSKINENGNNIECNINKSEDEYHNNSINFNEVNLVNKFEEKNNYSINNYMNEGISVKKSEESEQDNEQFYGEYSERRLSPNPYDENNIFIDSFNEMSPNENYNLGNLLEHDDNLVNSACRQDCFPFQYNYKSEFKLTEERI